jgi:uncharacterized glyoxalase superfamily metalloenzyme YdcJ
MELTKEAISTVALASKGKYYYAKDVDNLLDMLANTAQEQQDELMHLRNMKHKYTQSKQEIAEVLLEAKRMARTIIEEGKKKVQEETGDLEEQKRNLKQEIVALEQYKEGILAKIQRDLKRLLERS